MGSIKGHIERVHNNFIYGWAADLDKPAEALRVSLKVNGREIGIAIADIQRQDLIHAGIGTGKYGFKFYLPEEYHTADSLVITADAYDYEKPLVWSGSSFANEGSGNFVRQKTDAITHPSAKLAYSDYPSIIFLTTPTSATASIWRILSILGEEKYVMNRFTDEFHLEQRMPELRKSFPPKKGNIILFNAPNFFNTNLNFEEYKLVLNMRDPRDLVCNQFHWKMQHPIPGVSEEELREIGDKVKEMGIDTFCLKADNNFYFSSFYEIEKKAPKNNILFATYALLCLEFDIFLKILCDYLEVQPTENQLQRLEAERVVNLNKNPQWIGHQWNGSDTMPGRYLRELQPETIAQLNEKYKKVLDFLAEHDHPSVRHTYSKQAMKAA